MSRWPGKEEKMEFDNIELEEIRKDEITGIVLQAGIADLQNQVVDAQEVKEACELWNQAFRHLTVMHRDRHGRLISLESLADPATFSDCFDEDFEILSSFCVDSPSVLNGKSIPANSWVLSLRVKNPEIFELIEKKELRGFSIGGLGLRSSNGVEQVSNLIVPEISIVGSPANRRDFLIIKNLDLEEIRKPYVNEYSCRLKDPGQFQEDSFRRMSRESNGRQYDIVVGRPKGKETTQEQSYRYPIEGWTKASAEGHCRRHQGKFEDIKLKE